MMKRLLTKKAAMISKRMGRTLLSLMTTKSMRIMMTVKKVMMKLIKT